MTAIERATPADAAEILSLQRLAYVREARIYGDFTIPPLAQTLEELSAEFASKVFLKALEGGDLVGCGA